MLPKRLHIIDLFKIFLFGGLLCMVISVHAQFTAKQADSILYGLNGNIIITADSAISIGDSLIKYYREQNDDCGRIRALAQQGLNYSSVDQYKVASEYILEAQKVYDGSDCNKQIQAFIYLASSDLYSNIGDWEISDSISKKAIQMFHSDWPDKVTLIKLFLRLGAGDRELEKVLPYLDTAYQLAKYHNVPILEQKALINIGSSYAMSDSFELAKFYTNLALRVAMKREAYNDLGVLYNNLAGLSQDNKEVLLYIDSALYFARLTNNLRNLQLFTHNKSIFYKRIGEYEKAYNTLWRAMEIKDTLLDAEKYKAITEMQGKYEAEKKSNEIQALKLENLNAEVEKLNYKRNQNRLFAGVIILLILSLFFAFSFFTIRRNRNALASKNAELSQERQRSEDLLLNILPFEIAQELKEKGKAEAKQFNTASILFTDVIEFTQTSESLATTELVEELNHCFKGFDRIVEKYKIEKIKTIGDSYMAAGGLPIPSEDSIKNTVLAALEMQAFIAERRKQLHASGKTSFEMRAGIHTGPVVAGIVGVKKFQYDIWGDTVNTASRLEGAGMAGKVNISQSTYEHLRNDPGFTFESRGEIEAKGKGKIAMYFVERVENKIIA